MIDVTAFAEALPRTGKLVLCTHRHPDPDGLGALVGMQQLLKDCFGLDSELVLEGRIRRAENIAMRKLLDITALSADSINSNDFCGVIVVDSQPSFTHTNPPKELPILAVIDHHEGLDEVDDVAAEPSFFWVNSDYGATSTMIYDLLQAFEVEPSKRAAAALFCGVRYDTNNLARDSTPLDERAYFHLQTLADRTILADIDNPPLPRDYFRQMSEAMHSCEVIGPVLLTLMDEVNAPEVVAEVADWFVRLEGQQWSLAGGACDNRYQVSLRTDLPGADAYPALRFILGGEGACGGHGRMAGGQISLANVSVAEVVAKIRERAIQLFGVENVTGEPLAGH